MIWLVDLGDNSAWVCVLRRLYHDAASPCGRDIATWPRLRQFTKYYQIFRTQPASAVSTPNTVIFDLDGTLVDTAPDLAAALRAVLGARGLAGPSDEEVRPMIGGGAALMVRRAFEAARPGPADREIEAAVADFLDEYRANLSVRSRPFPGVIEALDWLTARKTRLGVCTNKYEAFSVTLLRDLKLDHYFGSVLGGDSLPVRKPDGGHILGVIHALGAAPEESIMIGDSATDVEAARNTGIPVVLVSHGYTPVPAAELGADAVIDSCAELPETLAQFG